jgi:hypothetical protein
MQSYHRVHIQLKKKDRQQLAGMLTKGRESSRVLRRASVLCQLDRGQKATQVAASVGIAAKTVRPGKQRALDVGQSQRIIAMVCSPPPQGIARWSVRLIATEAVKRKLAPQVGRETIRVLLQSHELKPWREKNVVRGGTE